ncbi:MAG: LysR family transcriptional regulator ArgP [Acidiphilium sp.]
MIDYENLAAIAAVVRTGSFEKAAQTLHVTPSAVSQRVKAFEERLGTVLIVRGQPCAATAAGERLCRHAEIVGLLEHALRDDLADLAPPGRQATLRIAVNADSVATWFIEALGAVDGLLFDLVLDDQDHSADWLRRGRVSAAVTATPGAVQGCGSIALGALRYLAVASPGFVDRWFAGGVDAASLRRAPCLRFDAKDELQARWMSALAGEALAPPSHWLPSSDAFIAGTLAGLGWGMIPEVLARDRVAAGRLAPLRPGRPLDVPLYWQWSRLVEGALKPVTKAVAETAARWLEQSS